MNMDTERIQQKVEPVLRPNARQALYMPGARFAAQEISHHRSGWVKARLTNGGRSRTIGLRGNCRDGAEASRIWQDRL